jgi:hypothetical protein
VRFPDLTGPSWVARFDSYNQRTEEVFYLISVAGGAEFALSLDALALAPDAEADLAALAAEIDRLAARGVTNTPYRGYNG